MEEFIEAIRANLDRLGEVTELCLNYISLFLIIFGVVLSVISSLQKKRQYPGEYPLHLFFRLFFGGWLVVALEVQLAADIVATIVSPTKEHLIQLGAIALIRTYLNYFLGKELKEESEVVKERLAETKPRE